MTQLRAGTLGLVGLTTLGAVMTSPALGVYGTGDRSGHCRLADTAALLASLLVALPTAVSYAIICRELPSTGSAFSCATDDEPRLGQLGRADHGRLLRDRPPSSNRSSSVLVAGMLVVTAVGAALAYRGVEHSTRTAVVFVIVESSRCSRCQ